MRADLPAGTVTLLFTDIEGSTLLIDELGEDAYVRALAEHRRVLRVAFSAHGGVEVDTQGDAFLYAFADPAEALAAADQGQEALTSGELKVRMGLHTGELQLTSEGYAGRDLHRAAARSSDLDFTRGETPKLLEMARSTASALPARSSVLHRCTSGRRSRNCGRTGSRRP